MIHVMLHASKQQENAHNNKMKAKVINTFIQEDPENPGEYWWNTDDQIFEDFKENYEERFGLDQQVGVVRSEAIGIVGSAEALDAAVEEGDWTVTEDQGRKFYARHTV